MENTNNINNNSNENLPIISGELDLSINRFNANENFYKMAFQFQQIMMIYESAVKQIETKLEILNKENKVRRQRNPIETVKSRIKSPDSIAKNLKKRIFLLLLIL